MKQILTFVFILFVAKASFAQQTVVVSIQSTDTKLPLAFATVETEKGTAYATQQGFYTWDYSISPIITITNWNFADTTLRAGDIRKRDTLFVFLKPQPEQLDEVLVQSGNSWLSNIIFGFERWRGGWVFLMRKKLVVADNKLDKQFETRLTKVNRKWPTQMFADLSGNTFLVWKDSIQQFAVLDGTIHFYPKYAKAVLNLQLKPLLKVLPGGIVYRETAETNFKFTSRGALSPTEFENEVRYPPLHNCGALVKFKNPDTTFIIATSVDKSAYAAAQDAFGGYAALSIRYWSVFEDSGYFNTGIKRAMGHALHSYKTQFSLLKQVYFLGDDGAYTLFDPYGAQLIYFNSQLKEIDRTAFNFSDCPREDYLIIDNANLSVWIRRQERGLDKLYLFENSALTRSGIALEPFVTNIRVHSGIVFYLNQYGKLRIKKLSG